MDPGGMTMDFKCSTGDNRGIYHPETGRALIYLAQHESMGDIYKTIDHETFHHCFEVFGMEDDIDEDQEEALIFALNWAEWSLI